MFLNPPQASRRRLFITDLHVCEIASLSDGSANMVVDDCVIHSTTAADTKSLFGLSDGRNEAALSLFAQHACNPLCDVAKTMETETAFTARGLGRPAVRDAPIYLFPVPNTPRLLPDVPQPNLLPEIEEPSFFDQLFGRKRVTRHEHL